MKNLHTEKFCINDTNVDFELKLSLTELIRFLQVTTFNHSNTICLDHKTMQEGSNAFWVITKLKVKLKKDVHSGENIKVATWTHPLTAIRAKRDFKVKQKNSVIALGSAEWCCLDCETRKIRKLSSIKYPDLEMVETNSSGVEFSSLNKTFNEKNYIYTREIRSSDIDVNIHTNNLKYNSIALDTFSIDELKNLDIKEYEIHFVNESKLLDKIDVFKLKERNTYFIEGRVEDKVIFRVMLKTKKRV